MVRKKRILRIFGRLSRERDGSLKEMRLIIIGVGVCMEKIS